MPLEASFDIIKGEFSGGCAMLRYPCLVLDHDDTVVQSEATVNYPFFVYILDAYQTTLMNFFLLSMP